MNTLFITFIRKNLLYFSIALVLLVSIIVLFRLHLKTQIDDNWEQFRVEHQCKKINTLSNGKQRAGWECDDGEVYYRWHQMR